MEVGVPEIRLPRMRHHCYIRFMVGQQEVTEKQVAGAMALLLRQRMKENDALISLSPIHSRDLAYNFYDPNPGGHVGQ
nr:hypothetical protein [Tanacetum cinerariifolium]